MEESKPKYLKKLSLNIGSGKSMTHIQYHGQQKKSSMTNNDLQNTRLCNYSSTHAFNIYSQYLWVKR
jgi:hypothetical protein